MRHPLTATGALSVADFRDLRRDVIFTCCKWDPQVGDHCSMADFALVIDSAEWNYVSHCAENLYAETIAAETELMARSRLHKMLGLPRGVLQALRRNQKPSAGLARIMRFDFHFTESGWQISEVNSDVPGGLVEASGFSRLMAARLPAGLALAGDPARAYVRELAKEIRPGGRLALIHATSYTDDRQMMEFVARGLKEAGIKTEFVSPLQIQWRSGQAFSRVDSGTPLDGLVRFYPAEWLASLPRRLGGHFYFRGGYTPQSNPAYGILTQSKRFPLVWDRLATSLTFWRKLLPHTCAPQQNVSRKGLILKPALGRVGESILMPDITGPREAAAIRRSAWMFPSHWVSQLQFQTKPVITPHGPMYPCLGVYVIGGHAAGIYGRISPIALTDLNALDIAVLVNVPGPASRIEPEVCIEHV